MDREVYAQLIEWKSRRDHKPLVVDGARQVGKTHIIKEFGDKEYANYAYVNLDKDNVAKAIFEPDHDIERIITQVSQVITYYGPEGCASCETSSPRTFPC